MRLEKGGQIRICLFFTLREIVRKFRQWQFTSYFITQDFFFFDGRLLQSVPRLICLVPVGSVFFVEAHRVRVVDARHMLSTWVADITQDLIFHTFHALSNGVAEEAQVPEPVFMTMPTMVA